MTINEKISEIMKERDISYGELARATGLSKTAIYKYATGKTKKIPIHNLEKIAKALHEDFFTFFYAGDEKRVGTPHILTMDEGKVTTLSVAFVDVLERLGNMYKEGLLTAEEFQAAKDRIIKENLI